MHPTLADLYSKRAYSIMVYLVLKAIYIINKNITINLCIKQYFTVSNEDLPEHGLLQSDKGCEGERGSFLYLPAIYVIIEFYVQDTGNSQYYIPCTFSSYFTYI